MENTNYLQNLKKLIVLNPNNIFIGLDYLLKNGEGFVKEMNETLEKKIPKKKRINLLVFKIYEGNFKIYLN